MATVYHCQYDYARAVEYYEKCLRIYEESYGVDHQDVSMAASNLHMMEMERQERLLSKPKKS